MATFGWWISWGLSSGGSNGLLTPGNLTFQSYIFFKAWTLQAVFQEDEHKSCKIPKTYFISHMTLLLLHSVGQNKSQGQHEFKEIRNELGWRNSKVILQKNGDIGRHGSLSSVQSLSHVLLFATPWTIARQASLSIINCRIQPKPMSIESVMSCNHLILCRPLLLPSIFPSGLLEISK